MEISPDNSLPGFRSFLIIAPLEWMVGSGVWFVGCSEQLFLDASVVCNMRVELIGRIDLHVLAGVCCSWSGVVGLWGGQLVPALIGTCPSPFDRRMASSHVVVTL